MEFITANYAPIMFAGLIVFLLLGFPVAFSLGACGLGRDLVGHELLRKPGHGHARVLALDVLACGRVGVAELRRKLHLVVIAQGLGDFLRVGRGGGYGGRGNYIAARG